jgi:hypothetical protein
MQATNPRLELTYRGLNAVLGADYLAEPNQTFAGAFAACGGYSPTTL